MAKHPYQKLQYQGESVEIDRKIVPFIQETWNADLATFWSCQDNPAGFIAVGFAEVLSAQDFVGIVAQYATEDVAVRACRGLSGVGQETGDGAWNFSVYVADPVRVSGRAHIDLPVGFRYASFAVTVRFPHSDLKAVVAALRQANAHRLDRSIDNVA